MKFGSSSHDPKPRTGDINGFLGEGVEIQGEVVFKDTLRVDGKVRGTFRSDGELVVGPTGDIEGEVTVGALSVSGRIRGTMRLKERLEVHSGGRVEGDVLLGKAGLVVHDGGVVEAKVQMGGRDDSPESDPARRSARQQVPVAG